MKFKYWVMSAAFFLLCVSDSANSKNVSVQFNLTDKNNIVMYLMDICDRVDSVAFASPLAEAVPYNVVGDVAKVRFSKPECRDDVPKKACACRCAQGARPIVLDGRTKKTGVKLATCLQIQIDGPTN